jgi:hypothetical protein
MYLRSSSYCNLSIHLGKPISLCIKYYKCSYPIISDAMSYKGQKDYKSCKLQSHTTMPLLIYNKHHIIFQIHNRNNIYANQKIKLINNQNGNSLFKVLSINKSIQMYAKNRKIIIIKKICLWPLWRCHIEWK